MFAACGRLARSLGGGRSGSGQESGGGPAYGPRRMSDGRILLARHGETAAKRRRLFLGRSELQLNEAGRAQAERLAVAVAGAGLVRLYASPSGRTMQTAAIVGSRVGLSTIADDRLVETHKGRWERRARGGGEGGGGGGVGAARAGGA